MKKPRASNEGDAGRVNTRDRTLLFGQGARPNRMGLAAFHVFQHVEHAGIEASHASSSATDRR